MNNSIADYTKFEEHLAKLTHERRSLNRSDCAFEAVTQLNGEPRDTVYVSNMSKYGLMMIVTPGTFIPREFQLLGISEQPLNCRMVWRDGENIGVEFIA